jgi:5-methyltetrahydrofolate--homocysteine methyltransferase
LIIIGEKINGAIPSVARAIEGKDAAFISELALRQTEAGADYLDVCAGTVPEREIQTLEWLVEIVEGAVDTPICLDSPDAKVIATILPSIRREGIVNSVSEESRKCEIIYPLIAGTGWKVIALTCDDSGIPSGVEKKVEIAGLMIDKAKAAGIAESRIFIDTLVLAVSAVNDALAGFTESLRLIREIYHNVRFTSGLSNISFGMPNRKLVNKNFLAFALQAGMDSAIMDPTDKDMYATILAAEVLLGRDKYCRKYNNAYRNGRLG